MADLHQSDSTAQSDAESLILVLLGGSLGVSLEQGHEISIGAATARPDGVSADESVFVEVFAHLGKLKGGQRHKVSTDALKLLAIRAAHPEARLILAFADEVAASSVSGWRAETLKNNAIEICVVKLSAANRAKIEAAQVRQRMVNSSVSQTPPDSN